VAWWTRFGHSGFLWLSVLWGGAIAWFVARDLARTTADGLRALAPHLVLMGASTYLVVGILG
jgi:hypothetical protein